jgi:hypothetical protein
MDPATLAASAVAILTPYVSKAGKELVDTVGQLAYDHAKKLFTSLKARWSNDPVAADTLSRFEKKPEVHGPALQEIVEERVQTDNELREEIDRTAQELGPQLNVFLKLTTGENVTAVDIENAKRGKINASVEAGDLRNSSVAKITNFG